MPAAFHLLNKKCLGTDQEKVTASEETPFDSETQAGNAIGKDTSTELRFILEGRVEPHYSCNAAAVDVSDQHTSENKGYAGKTAVVVGGGPSGSVAAAYLARNGFTVKARSQTKLARKTE